VSKVTLMTGSKISNFVDIFAHSHLTLSSSFFQTQQPLTVLQHSTATSANGLCQV